jgi:hypothetical protein
MRTAFVTLLALLGLMVAIEAAHLNYHSQTAGNCADPAAGTD